MKDLKDFILESQSNLFDELMNNFFCGCEEDGECKEVRNIVKNFLGNTKSISIESSVAKDYWEDFGVKCKQNNKVKEEVEDLYKNDPDWCEMDIFALKVIGDVLYMSSQTGTPMNGDYFDVKITKK